MSSQTVSDPVAEVGRDVIELMDDMLETMYAAPGIGLAAIQIAQSIGAEIFATAGSDQKRDFLRSQGVTHVMDSRSLEFADQITLGRAFEGRRELS